MQYFQNQNSTAILLPTSNSLISITQLLTKGLSVCMDHSQAMWSLRGPVELLWAIVTVFISLHNGHLGPVSVVDRMLKQSNAKRMRNH